MDGSFNPGDFAMCTRKGALTCKGGQLHTGTSKGVPNPGFTAKVLATEKPTMSNGMPCTCGCETLMFGNGISGISSRFVKLPPKSATEDDEEVIRALSKPKLLPAPKGVPSNA